MGGLLICIHMLSFLNMALSSSVPQFDFSGGESEMEYGAVCPPGSVFNEENGWCLQCADGTYERDNKECVDCELGTYNPDDGSNRCQPCPGPQLSTMGVGSYSVEQCIEVCEVPDVKHSRSVEPVIATRVAPDTLVKIMCKPGFKLGNQDEVRVPCKDTTASCTCVTVEADRRSVTAGDIVTATCKIVTGTPPTHCNWYSNNTLLISEGEITQQTDQADTYHCVHTISPVLDTINIICTARIQEVEETSQNSATVLVTPCIDCGTGKDPAFLKNNTTNMLLICLSAALLMGILIPIIVKVIRRPKNRYNEQAGKKYNTSYIIDDTFDSGFKTIPLSPLGVGPVEAGYNEPEEVMANVLQTVPLGFSDEEEEGNPYPPRVQCTR